MGTIKVFGGKRHVSATHVRLIKDADEIYHHLLKALYISLSIRNPGGAGVSRYKLTETQSDNASRTQTAMVPQLQTITTLCPTH